MRHVTVGCDQQTLKPQFFRTLEALPGGLRGCQPLEMRGTSFWIHVQISVRVTKVLIRKRFRRTPPKNS